MALAVSELLVWLLINEIEVEQVDAVAKERSLGAGVFREGDASSSDP